VNVLLMGGGGREHIGQFPRDSKSHGRAIREPRDKNARLIDAVALAHIRDHPADIADIIDATVLGRRCAAGPGIPASAIVPKALGLAGAFECAFRSDDNKAMAIRSCAPCALFKRLRAAAALAMQHNDKRHWRCASVCWHMFDISAIAESSHDGGGGGRDLDRVNSRDGQCDGKQAYDEHFFLSLRSALRIQPDMHDPRPA
jgi:hypothetical protein